MESIAEMIGWAAIAAAVWFAGYVVACVLWPYAACRWCKGDGRKRSPSGRAWRNCRRCSGSGKRVRFGRRLWTWLAARKHDAVG